MENKELRIGNWYENMSPNPDLKYEQVDFFETAHYAAVYCNPILLTEEWLVKLGFENNFGKNYIKYFGEAYTKGTVILSYSFTKKEEDFQVSVGTGGDGCDWIFLPKPQYVHQLQNLYFALTGEELTINI